jgi:hypothetical protein
MYISSILLLQAGVSGWINFMCCIMSYTYHTSHPSSDLNESIVVYLYLAQSLFPAAIMNIPERFNILRVAIWFLSTAVQFAIAILLLLDIKEIFTFDNGIMITTFIISYTILLSYMYVLYRVFLKKLCVVCISRQNTYEKISIEIDEDCSICSVSKLSGDIVTLNCKHTFHEQCIDKWIEQSNTCPLCRALV